MGNDDILTDDYVATLLAKDAKDASIKYSALGLEAFAPSKPPANKPKPNTRFLRNIIKDTDSHNAALLAKEAAESRARLKSLATPERRGERFQRVVGGDIRSRQLGDIAAILGGRPAKRKRTEGGEADKGLGVRREISTAKDEAPRHRSREERRERDSKKAKVDEATASDSHRKRHRSISPYRVRDRDERKKRHRSRSRSPREHRETRHRERSPRRKRSRSRSPERDTGREKSHRSHHRKHSPTPSPKISRNEKVKPAKETQTANDQDSDSDPLDDIIGPRPPPTPQILTRGRGTISQASGIDSRFSASYDPAADVQLDPDEDNDWDQALEALRDRQKWKQQGADRLRAAGFSEEEVKKWETGGEKREEDVKWAKKGEGREWDRGKVVGEDGVVGFESNFGRLKDS